MSRALPPGPLVAFYGDDFTGSSAAMEVLAFAGLETILFLDAPTPERLARFGGCAAIGIAGVARARPPEWMDEHLPPIFDALGRLGAPIVHYKVCSTFDSAPHIGNIGRAAELGLRRFPGWAPMIVADPGMGRYQAFGHLFANANGVAYRLDRHPTMSTHPVTPMHESDLGRHLAGQTRLGVGLVDLVAMKQGCASAVLQRQIEGGAAIVSLDVLDAETLREAGRIVWEHGASQQFVVGSQGIEQALVAYWKSEDLVPAAAAARPCTSVERIAVVSGSVSPITAAQIARAREAGFELIPFDATRAVSPQAASAEVERVMSLARVAARQGKSVLVFTAAGPDDPRVDAFRAAAAGAGQPISAVNDRLGAALGDIMGKLIREEGIRRCVISGGDTSGQATLRLGIDALTAIAPLAPGAPLCRAHSPDPAMDGLEITLKGGQTGAADFFTAVRGR
jgi:3-oxoisoapionate kinase